jgi:hypothetical protein
MRGSAVIAPEVDLTEPVSRELSVAEVAAGQAEDIAY